MKDNKRQQSGYNLETFFVINALKRKKFAYHFVYIVLHFY